MCLHRIIVVQVKVDEIVTFYKRVTLDVKRYNEMLKINEQYSCCYLILNKKAALTLNSQIKFKS